MAAKAPDPSQDGGFLDSFLTTIERVGNKVPHPGIIFFWLIGLVILLSVILSFVGWSATYSPAPEFPETPQTAY